LGARLLPWVMFWLRGFIGVMGMTLLSAMVGLRVFGLEKFSAEYAPGQSIDPIYFWMSINMFGI
jgi:hypothetical protein